MTFKENARPMAFYTCVATLCLLGILESIGIASVPTWVIGTLGGYSSYWLIERGVTKAKGKE